MLVDDAEGQPKRSYPAKNITDRILRALDEEEGSRKENGYPSILPTDSIYPKEAL